MRTSAWIIAGLTVLLGAWSATARAATPQQIQAAIDKGVKYLYDKQAAGSWDAPTPATTRPTDAQSSPTGGQFGGMTAIATYALLSAGEDPKDPRMASAIRFLEYADIHGMYALGIRCLVWHSIPDAATNPVVRRAMARDYALLENALHPTTNMYNYLVDYPPDMAKLGNNYDHSVSQYGVLGMWALNESGVLVPLSYWKAIDAAWRKDQLTDGGWDYHRSWRPPDPLHPVRGEHADWYVSTASMTEAGIATLFLAQDEALRGVIPGPCHGNIRDDAIDRGLEWMADHFEDVFARRSYYSLYGLERIGVASGRVYFKDINWFTRGSDYLVQSQRGDGSWGEGIPDTAFAILFLVRGGAPVTINKLQYFNDVAGKPEEGDWNERPRDVANFNPWLGGQVEFPKFLNWQVLTLDAVPTDLHSAPVLLVTGDRALNFSPADEQKLKKYIDQGGLVLFNADCQSPAFTDSVTKLGTRLYPLSEFRPLTKDDTIFSHEQFKFGNSPPKVLSLSNGIRELMVLIPEDDISRAWAAGHPRARSVEFELGANIIMYACDKSGILYKGDTYLVTKTPGAMPKALKVARIQYTGNWDPEPEAWPRLAAITHNAGVAELQVDPYTPGAGKLESYPVAYLTGTSAPHIDPAGWDEIKQFVQDGGTLIVESAGGSPESTFTAAVHDKLAAMFPDQAAMLETPLPITDPFYATVGPPMTEVHFRPFARTALPDLSTPQLRVMRFGARTGVYYSPQDLTEGLVGQPIDGVVGYQPDTSVLLIQKMLLSAAANN